MSRIGCSPSNALPSLGAAPHARLDDVLSAKFRSLLLLLAMLLGLAGIAQAAPVISAQPRSLTIKVAQAATFTVSASSSVGPLSYQWFSLASGGTAYAAIPGATAPSYTAPPALLGDSGTLFYAQIGDGAASVTSAKVKLTVVPALEISAQPSNQTIVEGQPASFAIQASANPGPLAYQWYRRAAGATSYAPVADATSASLTLPAVTLADNGSRFYVKLSEGATALNSAGVALKVTPSEVITAQPRKQKVNVGASATFTVDATAVPGPASFQWFSSPAGGAGFVAIPGATGASLTLPAAAYSDNGSLFYVQVGGGVTPVRSVPVSLTVVPVITISAQPVAVKVGNGQAATFSVSASGNPGPLSYQWFQRPKGALAYAALAGETGSSTTLPACTLADGGSSYFVRMTDHGVTRDSAKVGLTVSSYLAITRQPQSQAVAAGTSATFSVAVVTSAAPVASSPLAFFQWYQRAKGRTSFVAIPGATAASYSTPPVTTGNDGTTYYVRVTTGSLRVNSDPATLTVTAGAPRIASFSAAPASIQAGQGATLSWAVSNAISVAIDQGIGAVAAAVVVHPAATTTYTLTASNGALSASAQTTVVVTAATPGGGQFAATGAMAAVRSMHSATLMANGKVLLAGGFDGTLAMASAEQYDPATGLMAPAPALGSPRFLHSGTLLANGKVLLAGGQDDNGQLSSTSLYDPADGSCVAGAAMLSARAGHSATLLPSGKVLVVGGVPLGAAATKVTKVGAGAMAGAPDPTLTAELYDPASNTFSLATGTLSAARSNHSATLLADGRVLIAGGQGGSGYLASAEVYDPATGLFTPTSTAMTSARSGHTATLLGNGQVLLTGGQADDITFLSSAELFDPATGAFTATGFLGTARSNHSATLLADGRVLLAGGWNLNGAVAQAETCDPASGAMTANGVLAAPRLLHSATLLPSGQVLIAGGSAADGSSFASAELFDPQDPTPQGAPAPGASLTVVDNGGGSLQGSVATQPGSAIIWVIANGSLVSGQGTAQARFQGSGAVAAGAGPARIDVLTVSALGIPAHAQWPAYSPAVPVITTPSLVTANQDGYQASVLPAAGSFSWTISNGTLSSGNTGTTVTFKPGASGSVLLGCVYTDPAGNASAPGSGLSAIIDPPVIGSFSAAPPSIPAGTGSILAWDVTGAASLVIDQGVGPVPGSSANVSPASTTTYTLTATNAAGTAVTAPTTVTVTAALPVITSFTANPVAVPPGGSTTLTAVFANGTGSLDQNLGPLISAGPGVATGPLSAPTTFTLTVTGPDGSSTSATVTVGIQMAGIFTADAGGLAEARYSHTATLLTNGSLLLVGGSNSGGFLASAELRNPANNAGTATGPLAKGRYAHTATLLPNGKVLVLGGYGSTGPLASAELYDPASGTFSDAGALNHARYYHSATLLPNGKVLVAGGYNDTGVLASSELYDPSTGAFTATADLIQARALHSATLVNGKVLMAGGSSQPGAALASAELYDPASASYQLTGAMAAGRLAHTAIRLVDGTVLMAGGMSSAVALASAELYDPATGSFLPVGAMLSARFQATGTLLPSGKVLLAGGNGIGNAFLASAECYDPATRAFVATGSLNQARGSHSATLAANGQVFVAGGAADSGALAGAEWFDCQELPATWILFLPAANLSPHLGVTTGTMDCGQPSTILGTRQILWQVLNGTIVSGQGTASVSLQYPDPVGLAVDVLVLNDQGIAARAHYGLDAGAATGAVAGSVTTPPAPSTGPAPAPGSNTGPAPAPAPPAG